jgi:hypothetical protein
LKQVICDDHSEHGVTDEFERLVVKAARLFLMPRRNLFMSPRAMRDGALQERAVVETVSQILFQLS